MKYVVPCACTCVTKESRLLTPLIHTSLLSSKKRKFDDINTRIEDHSKTLENREKQLKIEKDILVNETGRVVETKGR